MLSQNICFHFPVRSGLFSFSLQHVGLVGARLQNLKSDNEFSGAPEPGVEQGIDQGVNTGVTAEKTEHKDS